MTVLAMQVLGQARWKYDRWDRWKMVQQDRMFDWQYGTGEDRQETDEINTDKQRHTTARQVRKATHYGSRDGEWCRHEEMCTVQAGKGEEVKSKWSKEEKVQDKEERREMQWRKGEGDRQVYDRWSKREKNGWSNNKTEGTREGVCGCIAHSVTTQ